MQTRKFARLIAPIILAVFAPAIPAQTAQSAQPAPPIPRKPRESNLRFTSENPVLGLPLDAARPRAHCSIGGIAYFDLTASSAHAGQDLYGISPDGGVKHILRKLPIDFTNVSVRDTFVGDDQVVTLLQADKRDEGTDASPPRETDYFLSLEDTAGDLSNLVPLQLRFKPLRVARFGSGDILVLGWDEGNLLPKLALVNSSGDLHRFIDFETRQPDVTNEASAEADAHAEERATLDALQGASFVPFASNVLLTYPGTTKPIRSMSPSGETYNIPIYIPAGYVLNDVLASGGRTLIVRVKEFDPSGKPSSEDPNAHPKMRVLEEDSYHGSLIREFIFDKPTPADLTCAPNSSLSAIFYDTIPDANQTAASDPAATPPTHLVVASARR
jgi:hypothetical protein